MLRAHAALAVTACSVTTLLAAAPAQAGVTILKPDGSPVLPEEATVVWDDVAGGYDVTLHALYNFGGYSEYDIRGSNGAVIDEIVIDVDGPVAGSPLFVDVYGVDGGLAEVRSIVQTGTAETFVREVRATGNIGSITAQDIGTVRANGDITGPIVSTTPNNPMRGVHWVEADGIVSGDVLAEQGRIGLVYGHAQLGTPEAPIAIRARHYVNGVSSLGDIHADVNTRANGGNGGIYILHAGGRFTGTLRTKALVPDWYSGTPGRMDILGGLDGTIIMDSGFTRGDQSMRLPVGGLRGQVVINAKLYSGGPHWTTPVYVGPNGDPDLIVLNGAGYTAPAELLGGGAIGVVPFALHEASTTPANGSTIAGSAAVRLRHYGPVVLGTAPIAFARRPAGSFDPFETLPAPSFTVELDAADPRTAVVTGDFEAGWTYRLRATDDLRCAVVESSNPPVAWTSDFLLTIEPEDDPCPADIGGNGAVDVGDLLIVLGGWGQAETMADLTGDGVVDVADLLAVLAAWGPCP